MEEEQQPTVYERYNYNGDCNLNAGERDRIVLVLNRVKPLERVADVLGTSIKTLYILRIRHRIEKSGRVFVSANIWKD